MRDEGGDQDVIVRMLTVSMCACGLVMEWEGVEKRGQGEREGREEEKKGEKRDLGKRGQKRDLGRRVLNMMERDYGGMVHRD